MGGSEWSSAYLVSSYLVLSRISSWRVQFEGTQGWEERTLDGVVIKPEQIPVIYDQRL